MHLAALLLLVGAPGPLTIEMAGGADPCALQRRVPTALARWMSANVQRRPLALTISPRGGELLLTLVDDQGQAVLRRAVPNRPTACGATADGIALVIETYLRDLGWTVDDDTLPETVRSDPKNPEDPKDPEDPEGRPPPAETTPPPGPTATSTGATDGGDLPPDEIEPLPLPQPPLDEAPTDTGLSLRLGARAVTEAVPQPTRVGGEVTFRVTYDLFEAFLQAGALGPGSATVQRDAQAIGAISFWSQYLIAGPGVCLRGGWGHLCGLARVGVERLTARASGDQVFQAAGVSTLQLLTQSGLNYSYSLGIFTLTASADAQVRPQRASFSVEGGTNFQPPWVAATFSLGAEVRIY